MIKFKNLIFLLLAVFCWGLGVPLSKALLGEMPPMLLLWVQLLASVATLTVLVLFFCRHRLQNVMSIAPILFLMGILEPGLAYYLGFLGLSQTSSLHASFIFALEPIGIVLLGALIFRVNVKLPMAWAIIGALCGVALMVSEAAHDGQASLWGDALVFSGTMVASFYVLLSLRRVIDVPVVLMLWVQQIGSLAFVSVIALWRGDSLDVPLTQTIGWAACAGVIQFTLAFVFYFQGVKGQSDVVAAVVLNLTPIVAILFSVLWLGEDLSMLTIIGGGMVVAAALYCVRGERHNTT